MGILSREKLIPTKEGGVKEHFTQQGTFELTLEGLKLNP